MIVESAEQARKLCHTLTRWSVVFGFPVGVDTEFENAGDWSPIGRAKLFCAQVAWGPPPERFPGQYEAALIPAELVHHLKPWFENSGFLKTGSSVYTVERHVLANEGIQLRGIAGCTWLMSKLLNPDKVLPDGGKHGLKDWAARIGWPTEAFKDLPLSRPKPGKLKTYKRDRVVDKDGVRVVYTAGAELQAVSFKSQRKLTLTEAWQEPWRREKIAEYALKDPKMSLDVYYYLRAELEELDW